MTEPNFNYLGPITRGGAHHSERRAWWGRVPIPFLIVVVLPALIAAVYFFLVASPRYVSEARFIVRAANEAQPSSIGVALQGVGLSSTQTDAFAVHEFMTSREGFDALRRRYDLRRMLNGPGVDLFSRYPRPWEGRDNEAFYEALQRYIVVGYDSTTGISTIRVEAFRPEDAQAINDALLTGGEQLINRLNERAAGDAVKDAEVSRDRARLRLSDAQQKLTGFRNREQFIDPEATAAESARLVGGLLATMAQLRADRAQLVAEAPNSPQLSVMDSRIRAYEAQIANERAKIAGDSTSLAPKLSTYEDLVLNRELADKELAAASVALTSAEEQARKQKLYLDRIVNPNLPDAPIRPNRLLGFLSVLMSVLVVYGIGWFIWAGATEHRQE